MKSLKINYITLSLLFFFINRVCLAAHGSDLGNHPSKLPDFSYMKLNGEKFSNSDLNKDQRLMIVYFNPGCDICVKETQEILENINFFNDIQILFVSPNELSAVKKFANDFKMDQYKQITLLHDSEDVFYKQFNALGYPTVYLYDSNRKLIEVFEREVHFNELQKAFMHQLSAKK